MTSLSDLGGEITDPKLAEALLTELAGTFLQGGKLLPRRDSQSLTSDEVLADELVMPGRDRRFRALVDQLPAIVFMASLNRGVGEAYVSPQIEEALGYTQEEWLEDPVRWYDRIHPLDKDRWSNDAAEMLLEGKPVRSTYRVVARDGSVVWFHCEVRLTPATADAPGFIHGVAFDISEVKRAEEALWKEQNFVSTILGTVSALVVVMGPSGRIVRVNRACEQITGYPLEEIRDQPFWKLLVLPEDPDAARQGLEHLKRASVSEYPVKTKDGGERLVKWTTTMLCDDDGRVSHFIATGADITEEKRLEQAISEVSAEERRRIGQELHDGLGQQLTGMAFLSKALERNLADQSNPIAADAEKLARLVQDAIKLTRNLAKGLVPVVSHERGLMTALEQLTSEVEDLFPLSCTFECPAPVLIHDLTMATELFHIAQECVNNALKHSEGDRITVWLTVGNREGVLTVTDNGKGIPNLPSKNAGMGLHLMRHRASLINGQLQIHEGSEGGTTISCTFPLGTELTKEGS